MTIEYSAVVMKWFPRILTLTDQEKLSMAYHYKSLGTEYYKDKKIVDAFNNYSVATKYLILINPSSTDDDDLLNEKSSLLVNLFNNMARCQLMKGNWEYGIDLCSFVVDRELNAKAFYRRGCCFLELEVF